MIYDILLEWKNNQLSYIPINSVWTLTSKVRRDANQNLSSTVEGHVSGSESQRWLKGSCSCKVIHKSSLDLNLEVQRGASRNLPSTAGRHVSRLIYCQWSKASVTREENLQSSFCRRCILQLSPDLKIKVPPMASSRHQLSQIHVVICCSGTFVTFCSFVLRSIDCLSSFLSACMYYCALVWVRCR